MSGQAALGEASTPRVVVLDCDQAHDVFEVLGITGTIIRVRTPMLFEAGEELTVRIERDGSASERTVRVRGHLGSADARVTELELLDVSGPIKKP